MEHGCSKWYTEEDRLAAELLLQLQDYEPPIFQWGCKRNRSSIQDTPPPLFHTQTLLHRGGSTPSRDVETTPTIKRESSSSATPISFSPTESSHKKKKECCVKKSIEDLTKNKAPLNELINSSKRKYKKPTSECGGSMQSIHHVNGSVNPFNSMAQNKKQKQPQMKTQVPTTPHIPLMVLNQNQMAGPGPTQIRNSEVVTVSGQQTTSLQVPSSLSHGLGHINGNEGPLALPESMANKDLNRAIAAQARRRRILICRSKNSFGHNKSSYSHR